MKKFKEYISEDISKNDLNQIEKYADKLFAAVGIDVEFTRHFLDRVNDERNKKPINTAELIRLFRLTFKKYGKKIAKMNPDAEAVISDMETDVNMPFVLKSTRNLHPFVAPHMTHCIPFLVARVLGNNILGIYFF